MATIHGYTYDEDLPPAPIATAELELLLQTLLWTEEDAAALRQAGDILVERAEEVLDVWNGYVGSLPHLVKSFNGPDGSPSSEYLEAVRARFGQWISDLCHRPWDAQWLAYQNEIGRRHVNTMGSTDEVNSAETHIPMRYLIAFIWPITATIRKFLAAGGHNQAEVDAMHTAWFKAVTLSVALWSQPYNPDKW